MKIHNSKLCNRHIAVCSLCGALLALLWGCASIGTPSGGARDEDPPRFVSANPKPGSVNVDPSDISITFNELVNVKNAFEKVVLSPPGKSTPRVSTRGRSVRINISDTLLPNTTYTIDFGDAIEDNNEGNILSGFAYTFSTGPDLDSLRISGMVLGAEDMEPQQGVFVGAYTSREDSAFLKMPFERLARTDEMGRFVIRGLQDTTYRLFALKDLDNDRHYANPEEDIAWFEDEIRPIAERVLTHDTIRDLYTGIVDTIVERQRTRFLPNNVLLRMYNTGIKPQYLVSYTRPDSTKLSFIFNAPGERQPRVSLAGDADFPDPLMAETSVGNDTLTFFLPPVIASRDTLRLAVEYVSTDFSTGLKKIVNDTVRLMKPKAPKTEKKKKKKKKKKEEKKMDEADGTDPGDGSGDDAGDKEDSEARKEDGDDEEPEVKVPTFKFSTSGPDKDIRRPVILESPVPLQRLDTLAFTLEVQEDTVWKRVRQPYRMLHADTLSQRRFKIEFPWERGVSYRLTADSLAATDLYGVVSEKVNYEFKTKSDDEVANLKLTLTGLEPGIPAFVQLIESGDKPKYTATVKDGIATFTGIDGGKYYARVYEDFNGDGKYTTGSYRLQRVFGSPRLDSIPLTDTVAKTGDVVSPDSTALSATVAVVDTIAGADSVALPDSVAMRISVVDRRPLTDKEAVERLVSMGYSLEPLVEDTVGTDILIAIQPDLVYYYPKTINVKKAWDIDQTWNVFETALDLQKPAKIKKNKPKRKNNQQSEQPEEEEDEDDFFGNPFNPNDRNNRNRNQGNFRTAR